MKKAPATLITDSAEKDLTKALKKLKQKGIYKGNHLFIQINYINSLKNIIDEDCPEGVDKR